MPRVSPHYLQERRRRIIEAASEVFSKKGVKAATMAEVAAAAGLSPGAIYRYFASKEDLARVCMGINAQEVADTWRQTVASAVHPLEAFLALSRGAFEAMRDDREGSILIIERFLDAARSPDSAFAPEVISERRTIEAAVAESIERAQLAGELPADIDPRLLAESLLAFYHGARLMSMVDPSWEPVAHFEVIAEVLARAKR
ncbi:HTH-type transcriptional repressor KstR2 [bacterium HR29]|nr:HTH-type transcriptional repressor KstR2 [bacterium HR29]